MDAYIRQLDIADPIAWVDSILGWLEAPAVIMLCHIQFAIPDVYQLYDAYLLGAKAQWEANNHLRYQSGIPQTRYFMTRLLEQTQIECDDAIRDLSIKRSIGYKDNIPLESTLSSGSGYISLEHGWKLVASGVPEKAGFWGCFASCWCCLLK